MHDERHLVDGLAHALAVGIAAVAGVQEQDVQRPLFHRIAQAAEIHLRRFGLAEEMIDELVVPFGLAALEGENALPFPDEVVAQRLQQDDGPQADDPVGVAGQRAAEPDHGARALGQRPVKGRDRFRAQPGGGGDLLHGKALGFDGQLVESLDLESGPLLVIRARLQHVPDRADGQNAVRARQGAQLHVGKQARPGPARIEIDDLHALFAGHFQPAAVRGIEIADVGPPQDDGFRVEQLVHLGGAAVHADHHPEHVGGAGHARFARRHGVHAARDAQGHERGDLALAAVPQGHGHADAVGGGLAVFFDDLGHAFRDHVHGLRVGDALPLAVFLATHGFGDAVRAPYQLDDGHPLGAHGPAGPVIALFPGEAQHLAPGHPRPVSAAYLAERTVPFHLGHGADVRDSGEAHAPRVGCRGASQQGRAQFQEMASGIAVRHGMPLSDKSVRVAWPHVSCRQHYGQASGKHPRASGHEAVSGKRLGEARTGRDPASGG